MYLVGLRNYLLGHGNGNVMMNADTGSTGGSGEGGEAGSGDNDDNGGSQGNEGNTGDSGASGDGSQTKTFSQDDVNAIAAREAKKATEKLLKQLGVTDFNSAKEGLDKFREIQDANKSEAEKIAEAAKVLKGENKTLAQQNAALTAQLAAFKAGVNADSLEDVIVLANNLVNDDTSIDDAIVQVLTKYPHFKAEAKQQQDQKPKPKFSEGDHKNNQKQNENDAWLAAFNFGGTVK